MARSVNTFAALGAALAVGGCLDTGASLPTAKPVLTAAAPANSSAATWQMPWQLSPVSSVSQAKGEATTLAWVPQTGYVRGTPTALATLGAPLRPASLGRNRTVEPCRDTVQGEATKIGAREVEAVSAGPERLDEKGRYVAPVRMRITYAQLGAYEVREALLTCVVDRQGKIVDAYS